MDRRVILAHGLMMAHAELPAVLLKRARRSHRPSSPAPAAPVTAAPPPALAPAPALDTTLAQVPERVVKVTGPLYTYGVSTRGARLVEATLSQYKSMAK